MSTVPPVLRGATIISWPGDYQPIGIAYAIAVDALRWGAGFRYWMRDNYTPVSAMYSQSANIPTRETYVDLDPHGVNQHGRPALRMTHNWSEVDRCGMDFLLKVKRRIGGRWV